METTYYHPNGEEIKTGDILVSLGDLATNMQKQRISLKNPHYRAVMVAYRAFEAFYSDDFARSAEDRVPPLEDAENWLKPYEEV